MFIDFTVSKVKRKSNIMADLNGHCDIFQDQIKEVNQRIQESIRLGNLGNFKKLLEVIFPIKYSSHECFCFTGTYEYRQWLQEEGQASLAYAQKRGLKGISIFLEKEISNSSVQ